MLQGKNFITLMDVLDHIFGTVGMGIANKYLTKVFILYQSYDMGHPIFIQFVKNIIQQ